MNGVQVRNAVKDIVTNLARKKRVEYTYIVRPTVREKELLLPNSDIVDEALVYHDDDLRAAQYWGSCGTAATIVQLRHLDPMRVERLTEHRRDWTKSQAYKNIELYTDEVSPYKILGLTFDDFFDRAAGRPKIDQAWLFAETRNSISRLENILCGPQSKLKLIPHTNIQNMDDLEDSIIKILSNNHLAYMSVDGAFQAGEKYDFPEDEVEWRRRVNTGPNRPPQSKCKHWIIDWIEEIIKEKCPEDDLQVREECYELRHLVESLEGLLGCPTHAITITGVYERNDREGDLNVPESPLRLYRVLDSNPGPNFTVSATRKGVQNQQGTTRYMTLRELWAHTRRMQSTRLFEWSTHKNQICGANMVQPYYWYDQKDRTIPNEIPPWVYDIYEIL